MADLLDISPVRARYFRTPHRLYNLDTVGELHHVLHEQVKGFVIKPADPKISRDLQFVLAWRDRSPQVQTMSDWVFHWLTSHWRQLSLALYRDSAGMINWAHPWAIAILTERLGPTQELSPDALAFLEAERADQRRINRNLFAAAFEKALEERQSVIFVLPSDAGSDGGELGRWCLAKARCRARVKAARVEVRRRTIRDLASTATAILRQWGFDLARLQSGEALKAIQEVLTSQNEAHFVTVVELAEAWPESLASLLMTLFCSAETSGPKSARICVLVNPGAEVPALPRHVEIQRPNWSPISAGDLARYLSEIWGCGAEETGELVEKATAYQLLEFPQMLYTFVQRECQTWVSDAVIEEVATITP